MRRATLRPMLVVLALCGSVGLAAQRGASDTPTDYVEVDVVVVDGRGRAVHGLTRADFSVKDDGKPIEVGTVREVRPATPNDPDGARTVVVLLDDAGVSTLGTQTIQIVARAVVGSVSPVDDVSVVRLHGRNDEPYGDRFTSDERIRAYRGSAFPYDYWESVEAVFARVRDISAQVAQNVARRKLVICIGSAPICNVTEPRGETPGSYDAAWRQALSAAAAANVAYYAIIPGRTGYRLGGLAEATGGEVFTAGNNVAPPLERILQDGSNHYVIGYFAAAPDPRHLRRVEVKTRTRGLHVHARRYR